MTLNSMLRAPRIDRVLVCGLPVALALLGPAPRALGAVEPTVQVDQQIAERIAAADSTQADGRFADAARIYVEVYELTTTSDAYRNSDIAIEVVVQGATAFRKAFLTSDRDYALCEESEALLSSFRSTWGVTGNPLPPVVARELQWVEERLAEAPKPEDPAPAEQDPRPAEPVQEPPDEVDPEPSDPSPDPSPGVDAQPPSRRPLGFGLIAGGAVGVATGAILVGIGAPLRARAEQYRDDTLASPEFTGLSADDQQTARGYLDAYVDDERTRGVTLMATGGALLGIGAATAVIGGVVLVRARRAEPVSDDVALRLRPRASLRRDRVSIGLVVDF